MGMTWFAYAMLSLSMYGLWGVLGARASHLLDARSVMWFSSLGILLAGVGCLMSLHFRPQFSMQGLGFALLTGLANGVGTLCFIAALRSGPVIPIILITALYPMVTILLSALFLHQMISIKQGIGILLSLSAIYCLI